MLKKYIKKPIVIEAMHFTTDNDDGTCINTITRWINDNNTSANHNNTEIFIETLEGTMKASCGDYIIKGVNGEFYPCKGNIFNKTYEEALQASVGDGYGYGN